MHFVNFNILRPKSKGHILECFFFSFLSNIFKDGRAAANCHESVVNRWRHKKCGVNGGAPTVHSEKERAFESASYTPITSTMNYFDKSFREVKKICSWSNVKFLGKIFHVSLLQLFGALLPKKYFYFGDESIYTGECTVRGRQNVIERNCLHNFFM